MLFKRIRRRFTKPCSGCTWHERRDAGPFHLEVKDYCTSPKVSDLYSRKDGKSYDRVECSICRGTWQCHFEEKEEGDE